MLATAALTTLCLLAPTQDPVSVLLLPLDARPGVAKDVADQVTVLLAAQLAKRAELRVLTLADVESVLARDKLAQAAGCDTASCWTELAGALNTDEVIQGSVGRLGVALVLSLSRIKVRTGEVVHRLADTITPADASLLILRIPYAARTLYPPTHQARVGRGILVGSLGLVAAAGSVAGVMAALTGLAVLGVWAADLSLGRNRHLVTQTQGMLLNVLGVGALGAVLLGALVAGLAGTGAVAAGVLP